MISDAVSFINDLASVSSVFYSKVKIFLLYSIPGLLTDLFLSGGKTVTIVAGMSLFVRMVCSAFSAIIIGFIFMNNAFLDPNNTMTTVQFGFSLIIASAFIGEALAKVYLYYKRFNSNELPDNNKTEQLIYGSSAILDLTQMSFTLLSLL